MLTSVGLSTLVLSMVQWDKMQPKKPTKVKVEIKKGADIVLQVALEMKTTAGGKVQF